MMLLPFCLFLLFLFLAPLYFPTIILQKWWWAGLHLWRIPVLPITLQIIVPLVPLFVLVCPNSFIEKMRDKGISFYKSLPGFSKTPVFVLLFGFFFLWIFRSTTLMFGDSTFYITDLIPREAASTRRMILMFDSIGATYFYSYGYGLVKNLFQIDVLTWYHILGFAFLLSFFAWIYSNRQKNRTLATGAAILLLFSANWSQATFGAPEHYAPLLLSSLAFAILAIENLAGREPTWKPCLAYAIGAFFHLGIGWLLPALLYLIVRRWRRDTPGDRLAAILCLAIPAFLTWSLVYYSGFDLSFISSSISSRGKLIPLISPQHPYSGLNYQYSTFDLRHLVHIFQEILLMGWPGIILIASAAPFVSFPNFIRDEKSIFLLIFLAAAMLFNLLWNPDLEFWRDQDLFSIVGLAWCLVGIYLVLGPAGKTIEGPLKTRIIIAAIAGGIAWRIPVILYHSVLAANYTDPTVFGVYWPFDIPYLR